MCTSPRPAGFDASGRITFSHKKHSKELLPFKVPCGKCVECLLERARDWSVRCTHEASLHAANAFLTLTYDDQHIPPDRKLRYSDFQLFMKRLRQHASLPGIGFFMCGEYGETTLRPHYHACIFGYDFDDKKRVRENKHGDQIWTSKTLTDIWGLGHTELGSVTQKSAGYVARYVLKKQDPTALLGFQKMSLKNAIGKRWIEKHWNDVFVRARGAVVLSDGSLTKVPRYYEKWFRENRFEDWLCYATLIKPENTNRLQQKAQEEYEIYLDEYRARQKPGVYKSPLARKREILKHKQKQLKRDFL